MSNFNRWYNVGDFITINRNMRAKGFMLKNGDTVKVTKYQAVDDSKGGWAYDIEVTNPKSKETYTLCNWVSQFDIYSPTQLADAENIKNTNSNLDDEILRLKAELLKGQ